MASSKLLTIIVVLQMSCRQLAFSLQPYLPSFDSYESVRVGLDHPVLTVRNEEAILWSHLFLQKLREFMATAWTPNILQGLQDPVCMAHLAHIGSQLDQWLNKGVMPDTFVLQLIDAWGKLPSGILRGHLTDFGDFEECIHAEGYLNSSLFPRNAKGAYSLSIVVPTEEFVGRKIPGPYPNRTSGGAVSPNELLDYMLSDTGGFIFMLPLIGTCFPDTCSLTDTQQFVNNVMKATFGDQVSLALVPQMRAEKPTLSAGAVNLIVAIAAILCICLVGTVVDLLLRASKKREKVGAVVSVLKCFSLYTNILNFLNARSIESRMTCLHGLEFLSFAWILLSHSWNFLIYQVTWNVIDLRESIRSGWGMMFILNATVAYDSLFVINGTIMAYTMLKKLDSDNKLNPLPLYFWKYIRVTLPVLLISVFGATLLPHVGNGPFWYVINAEADNCRSHWWHNILHLNSFYPYDLDDPHFICHANSWYVSADMIYFLVAPIFVCILWRWRNVGLGLLILWMLQPVVHTGVLTAVNDLTPTFIISLPGRTMHDYFYNLHTKPWIRSTPYAVGLLLGYLLYQFCRSEEGQKAYFSPSVLTITSGWIASTGIALAVLLGPVRFFDVANADEAQGSMEAVLYGSLHRFAWAIAIAWVIFACVNDYSKWMNRLLSWQPLVSLGKSSLCMYLCAQYVQSVHKMAKYEPVRYNASNFVEGFLFQLVASVLVGFALYVTVQAPVERLQELVSRKKAADKHHFVARNTVSSLINIGSIIITAKVATNTEAEDSS